MKVPNILVSGNHEEIKAWRNKQMLKRTLQRREDLVGEELIKEFPEIKEISDNDS